MVRACAEGLGVAWGSRGMANHGRFWVSDNVRATPELFNADRLRWERALRMARAKLPGVTWAATITVYDFFKSECYAAFAQASGYGRSGQTSGLRSPALGQCGFRLLKCRLMPYEIRRFIIIVATGILRLSATVLVFLVVALLHTH